MKTVHAAQGKWRGILSLWMDESHLTGKHGPCPICGGKDRFRFLDLNGSGSWVCNKCSPKPNTGIELAIRVTGKSFAEVAREIDDEIGNIKPDEKPVPRDSSKILKRVSSGVVREIRFTPVHKYLVKRGIKVIPENVGYHPSLDYFHDGKRIGKFPAMVSRIQNVKGERVSFHVVYLTEDGRKAHVESPKKILAPIGTGSAVYLQEPGPAVVIAEGVETALAGMQLFGLPGMAALSAGGMARIELPKVVSRVEILADADRTYTGQAAAYQLANRLALRGIDALVRVPEFGTDYADLLQEK